MGPSEIILWIALRKKLAILGDRQAQGPGTQNDYKVMQPDRAARSRYRNRASKLDPFADKLSGGPRLIVSALFGGVMRIFQKGCQMGCVARQH